MKRKFVFMIMALLAVVAAAIWGDALAIMQVGISVLAAPVVLPLGTNTQTALKEVEEKRGKLATDMLEIHNLALTEKRSLTAEEDQKWNTMQLDLDKYDGEIRRYKQVLAIESGNAEIEAEKEETRQRGESRDEFQEKYSAAFRNYMIGGIEVLDSEARTLLRSKYSDDNEKRAMTTGTGSSGGYAIPTSFERKIEVALLAYADMLGIASILNTRKGGDLNWPTINDTDNIGEMIDESTSHGNSVEPVLGNIAFKSYKFSSKPILLPYELIEDEDVDLEAVLADLIGIRLGRIMNNKFTLGTGDSQPQGVVVGASNSAISGVGATAITFDNLIDLEHSVGTAYRNKGKFMFNDATLKALRKIKDAENRYIWQPSVVAGVPATINGREYIVNEFMASIGASAKSVIFGDFSKFRIRLVGDYRFRRLTERYADLDQIAYIAYRRADSHVMDAGTHPIKYMAHAAS